MKCRTVRIWDYTQDACISVLSGHSAPVRGLMWNTEVPYLLISGSWDYTIRVWDTRDGTCLDTVYDHGADVYGKTMQSSCGGPNPKLEEETILLFSNIGHISN